MTSRMTAQLCRTLTHTTCRNSGRFLSPAIAWRFAARIRVSATDSTAPEYSGMFENDRAPQSHLQLGKASSTSHRFVTTRRLQHTPDKSANTSTAKRRSFGSACLAECMLLGVRPYSRLPSPSRPTMVSSIQPHAHFLHPSRHPSRTKGLHLLPIWGSGRTSADFDKQHSGSRTASLMGSYTDSSHTCRAALKVLARDMSAHSMKKLSLFATR